MSHFSALIAVDKEPTQTVLDDLLRPWHDCESAGCSEHLRDVDITAQMLQLWNSRIQVVRSADGAFEDPQSLEFYVDAQGRPVWSGDAGPPTRFVLPGDARLVWITRREWHEAQRRNLDDFAEICHAEEKTPDGRYLRRLNPNMKWDWWSLGGRFKGMLIPREGAQTKTGEQGANGTTYLDGMGVMFRSEFPEHAQLLRDRRRSLEAQFPTAVDAVRKRDLNSDAMRQREIALRSHAWSWCVEMATARGLSGDPVALDRIRADFGRAHARLQQTRFDHPLTDSPQSASDLYGAELSPYADIFLMSDIYLGPHDIADWIEAAPALLTSSIVENGSWYAAARFGAQDATETWQQQFAAIFAQIPADQWLAVVDYHL